MIFLLQLMVMIDVFKFHIHFYQVVNVSIFQRGQKKYVYVKSLCRVTSLT